MPKKLIILTFLSLILSWGIYKNRQNPQFFRQLQTIFFSTVTGGRITIASDGQIFITDKSQSSTISVSNQLPDGFPANLPIFPGARLDMGVSQLENDSVSVTLTTPYKIKDVAQFYQKWLPKKGWQINPLKSTQTKWQALIENKVWQGSIYISRSDNTTQIAIDLYR